MEIAVWAENKLDGLPPSLQGIQEDRKGQLRKCKALDLA